MACWCWPIRTWKISFLAKGHAGGARSVAAMAVGAPEAEQAAAALSPEGKKEFDLLLHHRDQLQGSPAAGDHPAQRGDGGGLSARTPGADCTRRSFCSMAPETLSFRRRKHSGWRKTCPQSESEGRAGQPRAGPCGHGRPGNLAAAMAAGGFYCPGAGRDGEAALCK